MTPAVPTRDCNLLQASAASTVVATLTGAVAVTALMHGIRPPDWLADWCGNAAPMFSTTTTAAPSGARAATVIRPLSCEPLPDIPGKAMTTALVEFPPGAYTGAHRHPGSVTAYVVSGAIRSQMAGAPALTYHAGQAWFEPAGALHQFAQNASNTAAATLLATFVADENCGSLVLPEPASP